VLEVGRGHAVEPAFDGDTPRFDAKFVPLVLLQGLAGRLVVFQILKPATAALVIDAATPGTLERVDFHLVAVHPPGGNLDRLAIQLTVLSESKHWLRLWTP